MIDYEGYNIQCPECGSYDLTNIEEGYDGLSCDCASCGCQFQADLGEDGMEYYILNEYMPSCPECGWRDNQRIRPEVFRCGRCGTEWRSDDDEEWFMENTPYPDEVEYGPGYYDDDPCIESRNRRCSGCGNCGCGRNR